MAELLNLDLVSSLELAEQSSGAPVWPTRQNKNLKKNVFRGEESCPHLCIPSTRKHVIETVSCLPVSILLSRTAM